MKYLKAFENFNYDTDRFTPEMEDENDWMNDPQDDEFEEENDELEEFDEFEDEEDEDFEEEPKNWGDQVVEKKKMNAGLAAYLDKKKGKSNDKKDDKKCGCNCDSKDKKEEKGGKGKGLTAAQKKLPEHLQKSILKKQK